MYYRSHACFFIVHVFPATSLIFHCAHIPVHTLAFSFCTCSRLHVCFFRLSRKIMVVNDTYAYSEAEKLYCVSFPAWNLCLCIVPSQEDTFVHKGTVVLQSSNMPQTHAIRPRLGPMKNTMENIVKT